MHTYNNGFVASNFTEESANFKGTQIRAQRKKTRNTLERERAEKSIVSLAKQKGKSVDEYITKIVLNNQSAIRDYVISKGEIPSIDPLLLGVQASLLRADDIATVAAALDSDDDEALDNIESAEYEAKEINSPDALKLPTDVQGALSLILDHGRRRVGLIGRARINELLRKIKDNSKANNFEASPGSTLGGGILFAPTLPGTQPTTVAQPTTSTGNVLGNILNIFDKVIDGITQVSGKVQQTTTAAGGLYGQVKNAGSDVGSDAITKSLKENLPYIIGAMVLLALLIYIAVYAAKRK